MNSPVPRKAHRECQLTLQALLQLANNGRLYTGDRFVREVFKTVVCEAVLPQRQAQGLSQMRRMYGDVLGKTVLLRIMQFKATEIDKQRAQLAASQLLQPTKAALLACLTPAEKVRYWCLKPLQLFRN